MKKETKIVLFTAGITFVSMLILMAIMYFVMLFVFTAKLGDFFYSLGCENISASLYYRTYEKSDDILYVYKALTIEIAQNDNVNIVDYFEEFVNDDEYDDFCSALITKYELSNMKVFEKSFCLDEINMMRKSYVKALNGCDRLEYAKSFAIDAFDDRGDLSLKYIGDYSISGILPYLSEEELLDNDIINKLQLYFDDLYKIFVENNGVKDNISQSYLIRLCNKVLSVGDDINEFGDNQEEKLQNIEKMRLVNDKIVELIK